VDADVVLPFTWLSSQPSWIRLEAGDILVRACPVRNPRSAVSLHSSSHRQRARWHNTGCGL